MSLYELVGRSVEPYCYDMAVLLFCAVRRVNVHHCAKFRVDRSNRCGDMADYRFFKMAAVPILDF